MTTTASSIIQKAHTLLSDVGGVRWPAQELVSYLNLGQIAIAEIRPDQKRNTQTLSLVSGHEQELPADVTALFDIPNNAEGKKSRITKVNLQLLDHMVPDWRSATKVLTVKHFMHNLIEPRKFDVYPPVQSGVKVTATVGIYPIPVAIPTGGASSSFVVGNIDLEDYWQSALLDYVLFRAYAKDAEFAGNAAMSKAYYDLFIGALGIQLKSTADAAPKS